MRRGKTKKPKGKLLTVWIPQTLLPSLDECAQREDSDRSKFIREAIREKLARAGKLLK